MNPTFKHWLCWGVATALWGCGASAHTVVCHVNYGGADQMIHAPPVASPYGVKGVEVGSYFLFRVVNQTSPRDLASVKIYTYANHDEGAAPIHQVQFSPAETRGGSARGGHGFTGLHWVYEPVRDGELKFWCGWKPARVEPSQKDRP